MAFTVLFSTLSFTVEKHYCGNMLVDISFFTEAASCGMEVSEATSKEFTITKKNCCKDLEISIQGQENIQNPTSVNLIPCFDTQYILPVGLYSFTITEWEYRQQESFKEYSPPLLTRDIFLLEQHFLI